MSSTDASSAVVLERRKEQRRKEQRRVQCREVIDAKHY